MRREPCLAQHTPACRRTPQLKDRFLHYYRWFLTNIYPSVNAAYGFAILAFNLGYLFDRTKYHNPLMWLIGTRLRRMTGADYHAIDALSEPKPGNRPGARSIFSPSEVGSKLLSGLSYLLPMSIFALKFLEWWYQSDFAKQLFTPRQRRTSTCRHRLLMALTRNGPSPLRTLTGASPRQKRETRKYRLQMRLLPRHPCCPSVWFAHPRIPRCCPICEDDIVTPTACQTGIVYCYTCIHRWIEGTHDKQESFHERKGRQVGERHGTMRRYWQACPRGHRGLAPDHDLTRIMGEAPGESSVTA